MKTKNIEITIVDIDGLTNKELEKLESDLLEQMLKTANLAMPTKKDLYEIGKTYIMLSMIEDKSGDGGI